MALVLVCSSIIFLDWKYAKVEQVINLSKPVVPKNTSLARQDLTDFIVIDMASTTASSTSQLVKRTHGVYQDYDPAMLPTPAGTNALFFFFAGWDELSRDLDMSITTYTDRLPARIVLLKTDFEKREGLKTKYGVTNINTFVLTDRSGKLIKKWSNSKTIEDIISELDTL
ncbi:MAG: hypothetical protein QG665_496 [Patescibacteria group bacterium]|nr:hypothetical protein [Patescibacteria group bacterium]